MVNSNNMENEIIDTTFTEVNDLETQVLTKNPNEVTLTGMLLKRKVDYKIKRYTRAVKNMTHGDHIAREQERQKLKKAKAKRKSRKRNSKKFK